MVVEPEDVVEIARKLVATCLAGDLKACEIVLAYTVGRPRQMPAEPVAIPLGAMRDAAGLVEALRAVGTAVASGEIAPSEASELVRVVEALGTAHERADFVRRLKALEAKSGRGTA